MVIELTTHQFKMCKKLHSVSVTEHNIADMQYVSHVIGHNFGFGEVVFYFWSAHSWLIQSSFVISLNLLSVHGTIGYDIVPKVNFRNSTL